MTDIPRYITLLGAEQVASAAASFARSAEEVNRAAGNLEDTLQRFAGRVEGWVERLEQAVERAERAGQQKAQS